MLATLLLAWFPGCPQEAAPAARDVTAAARAALAEAVDLPTPKLRARRAAELTRRREFTLEVLLAAMESFGTFEAQVPGSRAVAVPLLADGETELTEIHLYVPSSYDPARPTPLLLDFHGTGGSGRELHAPWVGVAEDLALIVASPSESGANDGYHYAQRERDVALETVRWVRRHFNVDENRVHATGISRGGHLVWDVALRQPDVFASLAPMIGGPRLTLAEGQNNLRLIGNLARVPVRDLQGALDDPNLVFNVRLAFERLAQFSAADAELIEFPDLGHAFEFDAVDWRAFLGAARRDPRTDHVVRYTASADAGRAFWIEIQSVDAKQVRETFRAEVAKDTWEDLDDAGRKRLIARLADERTARLEVTRRAPGQFDARGTGVERFRLLLSEDMLPADGPLRVQWEGKAHSARVQRSRLVLVQEFVERFDRTFLPVVEVEIR
jgi:dienelactone hydrolase